jgi:RNA polymerase sigma factor (sigma-70 family)
MHFHTPLLQCIRGWASNRNRGGLAMPEDVLQETLVEAFRKAKGLEARGGEAFFGWLKSIARTRQINMIVAAKAMKRGGGRPATGRASGADSTKTAILNLIAAAGPSPSVIVRRKEAAVAVAGALAGLEPLKREVMELRYGKGMSIQEIGQCVGKNEGAVKMIINRSIKELREAVAKLGEFTAGA